MKTQTLIAVFILLASCGQTNSNSDKNAIVTADTTTKSQTVTDTKTYSLKDTTIKFLWREMKYDEQLKDTLSATIINEDYCKIITDPERAALGYVATFISNECWWDGEGNEDRNNLKCIILTDLDLGYQCSDRHLGFLRQWFKNDTKVLADLKSCPTVPSTSTMQETFDEIRMTDNKNKIIISFKATSINSRENQVWSWTETDTFKLDNDNIRLVGQKSSR